MPVTRAGRATGRALMIGLSFMVLTAMSCVDDITFSEPSNDTLDANLRGQVRLADGSPAGAGVSVAVTVQDVGCTGPAVPMRYSSSTTTDAAGGYTLYVSAFRDRYLTIGGPNRTLCTTITASATNPDRTASMVVPALAYRLNDRTPASTIVDVQLP